MGRIVAVGSDHAGFELKADVVAAIEGRGDTVLDVGTSDTASCDYPDFAHAAAEAILAGRAALGVLVCGSGVGMSIAANRHPGIRAVVCSETFSARAARQHNEANVLCFGARVVGKGVARDLVEAFLDAEYEGGRHARRVEKIELKPA